MKALFSDLDKTIIFSDRFLRNYNNKENYELTVVDTFMSKDGKSYNCYMNKEISEFIENCLFVPVTARSIRRYKDISLLANKCKYAITSGGGNIMINNQIDTDYRNSLDIDINELNEIAERFNSKVIDDTYVTIPIMSWDILKNYINKYQCLTEPNGSVTIIPKTVSKAKAVRYLMDKLNITEIMCCGDSEADIGILNMGNVSMIPSTSLLCLNHKYKTYKPLSSEIKQMYKSFDREVAL